MLKGTVEQIMGAAPRALVLLSLMSLPLVFMESVRANDQTVIEHVQKAPSGAGLVLMVSLQRAH